MQFVAEVKSGGFKTKMVKEGPPVVVREIKLIVDSNVSCLDELSKMVNQPVRVELSKVQRSFDNVSFGDSPEKTPQKPLTPPKTTKRVQRKTALKD